MHRGGQVEGVYIADNLARTQMEDIKDLPYDDTNFYPVSVSSPGDYTVSIIVTDESPVGLENTLQRIKVMVVHGERPLQVLESYKAK